MKETAYQYRNLPIPGGGYVTGFLFHPVKENVLYIRTDIGGSYRFDYVGKQWQSLTEAVNMYDLAQTYPIAMAVDPVRPEMLYIASGINSSCDEDGEPFGKLSVSNDYGKTYVHHKIPCYVHGNMNGRGTGYRLVRDPSDEKTLYFASQKDGLFRTGDLGLTWEKLETGGERCMTFVWCSPDGNTLIAGSAGVTTGDERLRGHSLYVSYDKGAHFEKLMMPKSVEIPGSKWSGYVAHRYDYDGTYFYCTLVNTGRCSYVTEMGYSCDSGDIVGGRILRYGFDASGHIAGYDDITPEVWADADGIHTLARETVRDYGYGGISSCRSMPGLLAASTICREEGDMVFISRDYGKTWEVALFDLSIGNLSFRAPYMKPEYNGGHSLIHWLSDVKINPFKPDEVWFNSGTGVFVSKDFTRESRSFQDWCDGIEETVHLNVYGPVDGPVKVLDIVGDLGGFAFTQVDKPCENSFADAQGNRYITCINADFSDFHPETVLVTPRGNWKGKTKGGLILSHDYGQSFERIPLPYGITQYLDERFGQIERPNVNSGWAAISSDTKGMVYCVAEGIDLFAKGVVVSCDGGKSFEKVRIYNLNKEDITDTKTHFKVYADRVEPNTFYGFGDGFCLFVSKDKGKSFYQVQKAVFSETLCMGLIDCANKTEIRGEAGKTGIFYAALGSYGLYKVFFNQDETQIAPVITRISEKEDHVYRLGLGVLRPEGSYLKEDKALYVCGVIDGIYGFFRSFDDGKSWEKINNDMQQFGDINSIDGDSRCFGRYYIATGSFGLKYGEPV